MTILNWHHFRVELPCPSCSYNDLQLLGKLVGKDSIPCRACGEVIDISDSKWQSTFKSFKDNICDLAVHSRKGN